MNLRPTGFELKVVAGIEVFMLLLGLYVYVFANFEPTFEPFFPLMWGTGMVLFTPFFVFCLRKSK